LRKIQSNSLTLSPSSLYSLPWFLNRAEQGIIAPAARAPARHLPQPAAPSLRQLPGHDYPPPLTFPPIPSPLQHAPFLAEPLPAFNAAPRRGHGDAGPSL